MRLLFICVLSFILSISINALVKAEPWSAENWAIIVISAIVATFIGHVVADDV